MKILALAAFLIAPSAFANTYIICGKTADLLTEKVSGYELELSSENDNINGPVGKNWNLKLDQNGDWLAPSKKITAKNSAENGTIVITIVNAQGASGPVGTTYEISDANDDQPILEKYTMGGFAGRVKVGTFQCYSGND